MEVVTVSPKYQVVIPLSVRRSLGLKPGQKVQVVLYDNRIELIPIVPVKKMRGFLKGIDTSIKRDDDRVRTSSTHPAGWSTLLTNRMRGSLRLPSKRQTSWSFP